MATIINNPPDSGDGSSGAAGMIIAIVVIIAVIALFFVYGLPALRNSNSTGTNVNVPDKIQVDVNK